MSSLEFRAAAKKPDISIVQELLKKCDINELRDAAADGEVHKVLEILDKLRTEDKLLKRQGFTEHDKEEVRRLLARHIDINAGNGDLGNALHAVSCKEYSKNAIHLRRGVIFGILIKKGARVDAKSGAYGNALVAASAENHQGFVISLLANGANINAKGKKFRDALEGASVKGHLDMVRLLLSYGADTTNALEMASEAEIVEVLRQCPPYRSTVVPNSVQVAVLRTTFDHLRAKMKKLTTR